MHFIRYGQVEISSSDGARLGLFKEGECFGESAIITNKDRTLDTAPKRLRQLGSKICSFKRT